MKSAVGLDREHVGNGDAAGFRDAAEIVPHQVEDHQVLRLRLHVRAEQGGLRRILRRRAAARHRPLHRPHLGRAIAAAEEQLGRKGQHGEILGGDQRAMPDPLPPAQIAIERNRIADAVKAVFEGQVDLVDIARRDVGLHLLEFSQVGRAVLRDPQVLRRASGRRAEQVRHRGSGKFLDAAKGAEPQQRLRTSRRQAGGKPLLEQIAKLVGEETGEMKAGPERRRHVRKRRVEIRRTVAADDTLRRPEKAAAAVGRKAVVEQNEGPRRRPVTSGRRL